MKKLLLLLLLCGNCWAETWECKDTDASSWRINSVLCRMFVPTGWLVQGHNKQMMTFVPDPEHKWKL